MVCLSGSGGGNEFIIDRVALLVEALEGSGWSLSVIVAASMVC